MEIAEKGQFQRQKLDAFTNVRLTLILVSSEHF
jgi:hypothetical protein